MSSTGKLPWFPFNPTDFLSDDKVSMMSALEVGAYIRLLCFAWNRVPIGTLEASDKGLARLATLSDEEWAAHKDVIMAPFQLIDGRWHQKRMVADGEACVVKHRTAVESGAMGANKRWANRVPIATPCKPYKGANSNNINNKKEEPPNPLKGDEFQFDQDQNKQKPVNGSVNGNGKHADLDPCDALKLRIGSWFGRRPSTDWNDRELKALKLVYSLNTPESELLILESYYTDKSVKYLRQDPITLLNNFNGEIDRARKHKRFLSGTRISPKLSEI